MTDPRAGVIGAGGSCGMTGGADQWRVGSSSDLKQKIFSATHRAERSSCDCLPLRFPMSGVGFGGGRWSGGGGGAGEEGGDAGEEGDGEAGG
jgi:hypothetical protein